MGRLAFECLPVASRSWNAVAGDEEKSRLFDVMKKKKPAASKSAKEAMKTSVTAKTTIALPSGSKRKKKKPAVMYTNETLKKALDAIKAGMPISTASKMHNIPRTTLLYKNRGTLAPVIKSRGPECILGEENERHLVEWIFDMSKKGFPVSRVQLLDSIQLLLNQEKRTTAFKENRPGRHWYDAFRARHKEFNEKMSQNSTYSRASVTEEKLRDWFDKTRAYFQSKSLLDIDPSRVFNCEESALFLTPKGNAALVRKGDKTIHNFTNKNEKECLSTLVCGSADGNFAPPMLIFQYKRIPGQVAANVPKDWSIGHSENGWMTGETFYKYVAKIFHPWLVKNSIVFPVVLYLDAHTSHLTMALSDFCREKGIELVALYPNATRIMQPLDVAFFRPLETAWATVVHQWRLENNGERGRRENFAQLLQKAVETLDVAAILKKGFRMAGLHPFSANAINYQTQCKESETTRQIIPGERSKSNDILALVESNIEKEVLEMFNDVEEEAEWSGQAEHKSLFYFWRRVKNGVNSGEDKHDDPGGSVADDTLVANENGDLILRHNIFGL